jgi:tRNA A-37 threonylcarbamoyl transferase component Bud32
MNDRDETNSTMTDQEKKKQRLSQLYHSILFTKFYADIEKQHCTQWTQLLQQKLSKDNLQVFIDFETFTYQLFNQHHITILELPISLQLLGQISSYSMNGNDEQSFIKNGVNFMFHVPHWRGDNREIALDDQQLRDIMEKQLIAHESFPIIEHILRELPSTIQTILETTLLESFAKYDIYKKYLHHNLSQIVFQYSDKDRETGFLIEDGSKMVHYIDVLCIVGNTPKKLRWLNRPCEFINNVQLKHTGFMHYALVHNYIPDFASCIKSVMRKPVSIQIEWDSIPKNDMVVCYRNLYCSQSALVLQRISRAFDNLSSYESDELTDTVANNVQKIVIRYTARRHHMYSKENKAIILHLKLNDEIQGLYDIEDYYYIIKYSGLMSGNRFPQELQSSAASLPCLVNGVSIPIKEVIQRNLIWMPNVEEKKAFETCQRFIDKKLIEGTEALVEGRKKSSKSMKDRANSTTNEAAADSIDWGKVLQSRGRVTMEQPLIAWHVIKYNLNNMAQERILYLTTQAYYVFRYDFSQSKLDETHFKRHELDEIDVIDIGDSVVSIFTRETRRRSIFFKSKGRDDNNPLNNIDSSEFTIFTDDYLENHPRLRIHKEPPVRKRPDTSGLYSNVFTFFDSAKAKVVASEIAWMVYGVSVLMKGEKGMKPFPSVKTVKPKSRFSSLLYNKLGIGITSDMNGYWTEYFNPLYNKPMNVINESIDSTKPSRKLSQTEIDSSAIPMHSEYEELMSELNEKNAKLNELNEEERNLKIMARYQVQQQIGSGNEGTIYLATTNIMNQERKVAIKAVPYNESSQREKIDCELALVGSIKHENIVRVYETFVLASETIIGTENHLYIVMEYCETNMEDVIQTLLDQDDSLPPTLLSSWVRQIVSGLSHMHKNGIVHRDIKTENILVRTHDPKSKEEQNPVNWQIKLCDFGFSIKLTDDEFEMRKYGDDNVNSNTVYGTPLYMAPEIATFKPHDFKADVWSFGVVLLQILLKRPASEMPNIFQQMSRNPDFVKELVHSANCNEKMGQLAIQCCSLNPALRPSMDQILEQL